MLNIQLKTPSDQKGFSNTLLLKTQITTINFQKQAKTKAPKSHKTSFP